MTDDEHPLDAALGAILQQFVVVPLSSNIEPWDEEKNGPLMVTNSDAVLTAHISTAVTLEDRIVRIERLLALLMVNTHRPGNVEAAKKLMRSDDPLQLALELTKPESPSQ